MRVSNSGTLLTDPSVLLFSFVDHIMFSNTESQLYYDTITDIGHFCSNWSINTEECSIELATLQCSKIAEPLH